MSERSVIFSAFYADFCLCPKSVIITTLKADLYKMGDSKGTMQVKKTDIYFAVKPRILYETIMFSPYPIHIA